MYFDRRFNIQYLLERTAPQTTHYKRRFFKIYWKENLRDQINKDNCKNIFQFVFMFKRALIVINAIFR